MIKLDDYQIIETSEDYKFKENSVNQSIVRLVNMSNPNHFISFWQDIPLKNKDGTFNAVIEIPRLTSKKYEIDTDSILPGKKIGGPHFIKQDIKNGQLRNQ